MSIAEEFWNELKQEAATTRKHLERVPFDKQEYQPHEKSEKLGRLAIHVAEIIAWWSEVINQSELDFIDFEPKNITTSSALLAYFDELLEKALNDLKSSEDGIFEENWSMRYGETIYFTLPKKQVMRTFCMNHLVHHRAQLGVYLRLLDIPLPGSYGPSADEEFMV